MNPQDGDIFGMWRETFRTLLCDQISSTDESVLDEPVMRFTMILLAYQHAWVQDIEYREP
ncbi:hypothetical protein ARMSODRAFT_951956 [Armillaria solidipes]|uniref:Uncharacterized protein n=1 Tax=Armillaria solidipes TaxID=1076256 RepID=A0A2H3C515_9AGAR|nr:hypothetical protein ARMSODRAFT_951956 [Armillaria solidipes]